MHVSWDALGRDVMDLIQHGLDLLGRILELVRRSVRQRWLTQGWASIRNVDHERIVMRLRAVAAKEGWATGEVLGDEDVCR